MRPARLLLAALGLAAVAPAHAAFHLMKVVEVYAGSAQNPSSQYVVLQMYTQNQNFVGGHRVRVHDAAGNTIQDFVFPGSVPNGADQAKILIATAAAQTEFGITPDLLMGNAAIPAAGGKVCFDAIPEDCVAFGAYTGPATGVGTPFAQATGLGNGRAARRRLDIGGGANRLDASDDTDQSASDFVDAPPAPTNNAGQVFPGPIFADGFETD